MSRTMEAVFDGKVLRPSSTLGLRKNARYRLHIEQTEPRTRKAKPIDRNILLTLSSLSTDTGIADLAAEHDHYLYGTPKRGRNKHA